MRTVFTFLLLIFGTFVRADPSDSLTYRITKIARYVSSSQMSLDLNDYEQAELLAREAVHLAESQDDEKVKANTYTNLGIVFFKANKDIGAKKYLTKAIRIYYNLESVPLEAIFAIKTINYLIKDSEVYASNDDEKINVSVVNSSNIKANQFSRQYLDLNPLNYDKALDLLKSSKNSGDKELHARSLANAGILLSKTVLGSNTKNLFESASYLRNSLDIYYKEKIKSPEIKPIEQQLNTYTNVYKNLVPPSRVFGGIEVGSKGVKLSVVQLSSDLEGEYSYKILADTAINTEIIGFTDFAIKETVKAVKTLYEKSIQVYGIDNKSIFIAISSGVQSQAEKNGKLAILSPFQESIRREIKDSDRKIEVISPDLEARLVHIGVIHKEGRYDGVIVDIGSGNTKGGFFDSRLQSFEPFSVSWGTKSLTNEVDKAGFTNIDSYAEAVKAKVITIDNNDIKPLISSKSALRNRKNIVISGGIGWAIATIMHPEQINQAYVKFTPKDVADFKELATHRYEDLVNPETRLYNVTKKEDKEKARLEILKVFDVFDQKALIAGAELTETLTKEFSTGVPKNYYLARYGYIGWITGYIIRSLGE